jgi:hypothetical protein
MGETRVGGRADLGVAEHSLHALERELEDFGGDLLGREAVFRVIDHGLCRDTRVLDHPGAGHPARDALDVFAL